MKRLSKRGDKLLQIFPDSGHALEGMCSLFLFYSHPQVILVRMFPVS